MNHDNMEKKVGYFNLSKPSERAEYEAILNEPLVKVKKENFKYSTPNTKSAEPLITIWYEIEK